MKLKLFLVVIGMVSVTFPMSAKDIDHTKQLDFNRLTNKQSVVGTIKGFDSKNYKVNVKSNQSLRVNLESTKAYFNIYAPYKGPEDGSVFMGSLQGNSFVRKLSKSGTYTIHVYLMYAEASKDQKIIYTLDVGLE